MSHVFDDVDAPDAPNQPRQVATTSTSITIEWDEAHGNAFAVDFYRIEVAVAGSSTFNVVMCDVMQDDLSIVQMPWYVYDAQVLSNVWV